jgi:hypothetical protein
MTELTWKDSGIDTIAKMRGKKVGVWCCGNEPSSSRRCRRTASTTRSRAT